MKSRKVCGATSRVCHTSMMDANPCVVIVIGKTPCRTPRPEAIYPDLRQVTPSRTKPPHPQRVGRFPALTTAGVPVRAPIVQRSARGYGRECWGLGQGRMRAVIDLGELTPTRRPRPPPPAVAAVPGSNVDEDEDNDGDRGQCQQDQSPHGPQGGPCTVSVRTGLLALVILHSSTLPEAAK